MGKQLIFNADDFGWSTGVNRAIIDSHSHGVVTSTSFIVTGHAIHDAAALSRDYPDLDLGLHWDVWGEDEPVFDMRDSRAIREEFHRQVDQFYGLLGRLPTHVDSHRHAHRSNDAMPLFRELVEPLGVPLRGDGKVRYVPSGFYAGPGWQARSQAHVTVSSLERLLREEVSEGWTEFSCHPGYPSPEYQPDHLSGRVAEAHTLMDPRTRQTVEELRIRLVSFADYRAAALVSPQPETRPVDETWTEWVQQTAEDLDALVPEGSPIILVDEDQLRTELPGRIRTIPFLELDGKYWGPPADADVAIKELERLRQCGAAMIAFAWPAFWWLEHYVELRSHLRSQFPCPLESQQLVIFDLRPQRGIL